MLKKIKKIPLKVIEAKEGKIIKYLDKDKKYFSKFGEIYFSTIKKGFTKGWNLHTKTECFITVPFGSVKFELKNFKKTKSKKFELKDSFPELLIVPKNTWFKFWTKKKYSIIMNLIEIKHDKNETKKLPIT